MKNSNAGSSDPQADEGSPGRSVQLADRIWSWTRPPILRLSAPVWSSCAARRGVASKAAASARRAILDM